MAKTRHSSLEMPDPDVVVKEKKKQDMLSKARNKLCNLGDALKSNKYIDENNQRKSRTQATLDYFFKPCPNKPDKNQIYSNNRANSQNGSLKRAASLQKQHSVGSYPIKLDLQDTDDINPTSTLSRLRPATICVDKVNGEPRETAALALERPRKKLSFREPEIMGCANQSNSDHFIRKRNAVTPEMKRSTSVMTNGIVRRVPSFDLGDFELESQAMRVVRTVGQAFEVCHKLSIKAPENENVDYDEQDTLTQDLASDRLSDITSDKPKKDALSEGACDKLSLPDESSFKDLNTLDNNTKPANPKPPQLDVLPPPPSNNSTRKSLLTSGETYASPHSDGLLTGGSGSGSSSIPAAGSALSVHHELQLLREQLDQQNQQTQAAMAQLQLAREQLAAEQSARLEAQTRTHQLLVHNRELLDHIAALVAHLQGSDKAANIPQSSPLVTMPQQQQQGLSDTGYHGDHSDSNSLEHSPVLQALGLNPQGLIENRAVTSCLPPSPLRTTFNPGGGVFNFNYSQADFSLETQLLQRLQALSGYTPPQYNCGYNQNLAFLPNIYGNPLVNNNYTLQPPPQKKFPSSPLPVRHSYTGSPVLDKRPSPARSNETYKSQQSIQYQSQQNLQQALQQNLQQNYQSQQRQASQQSLNQIQQNQNNNLQVRPELQQQQSRSDRKSEPRYIKPLSQMGTLTTTDSSGRVRVIVPVPSNADDTAGLLASLRLGDDLKPNSVPAITRSTSEKVPNRSELMSQVQRTAWARHTTK